MNAPRLLNLNTIKASALVLLGAISTQVVQIAFTDVVWLLLLFGLLAFNEWLRSHLGQFMDESKAKASGGLPTGYLKRQRLYAWLHSAVGLVLSIAVVVFWVSSFLCYDRFAGGMENFSRDRIVELYGNPLLSPNHVLEDSSAHGDLIELSFAKGRSHYLAPAKGVFQHVATYVQSKVRGILQVFLAICCAAFIVFVGAEAGTVLRKDYFGQ
jgi:hypothetical protein